MTANVIANDKNKTQVDIKDVFRVQIKLSTSGSNDKNKKLS